MSKGIYKTGKCDYCSNVGVVVRPTPFMADAGAMMCKTCWDNTAEEYAGSEGAYIGKFEDGAGFEEVEKISKDKLKEKEVFDDLIENLRTEFEMGMLDATLKTISNMDTAELNDYLESDISYAADCCE